MPQIQMFDFTPSPRQESTALEKTISSFANRNTELRRERQESDSLKNIYQEYEEDGNNIGKMIQSIRTQPGISPTTRVNEIKRLSEFQKYNQELQKKAKDQTDVIRGIERETGRDEGSLDAFKSAPNIAVNLTKEPKGTQTDRPFNTEQAGFIEKVKNSDEYKKGSLTQKQELLTRGKVSKPNIDSIMETEVAQEKNDLAKQKFQQETKVKVDAITKDYDESVAKEAKAAKNQMEAANAVRKSLDKVKPTNLANVFKFFGETGKRMSDAILSGDQAKIQASIPNFLEGRKELFGVRLSDADLALLSDKLPDIGKSPEANKAILDLMEKYSERAILREEVGRKIKKANDGYRPRNYQDEVEATVDEMMKPVEVVDPSDGVKVKIPAYKLEEALIGGATFSYD